jgi:hypothetical protein
MVRAQDAQQRPRRGMAAFGKEACVGRSVDMEASGKVTEERF